MSRVAIRIKRPHCDAPRGWEGSVSLWRFTPGVSIERLFISKFDALPVTVPLRITSEIVGAPKTFILTLWLRPIDSELYLHRLAFLASHNISHQDAGALLPQDFVTKNALRGYPYTVWVKTDLYALLRPRRAPYSDAGFTISPPFRVCVFHPRSVSPSFPHPDWSLRIKVARSLVEESDYSPSSSDGISSDEKPDTNAPSSTQIDAAVKKPASPLKKLRLLHATTHTPVTKDELEAYVNGAPLSDMEEDKRWLVYDNAELVEDYIDVADADKALFKLWNAHVIPIPIGQRDVPQMCKSFMESCRDQLIAQKLRIPLLRHLLHLLECDLIGRFTFLACIEYFDVGQWPE